jgi:hypothetical protein
LEAAHLAVAAQAAGARGGRVLPSFSVAIPIHLVAEGFMISLTINCGMCLCGARIASNVAST